MTEEKVVVEDTVGPGGAAISSISVRDTNNSVSSNCRVWQSVQGGVAKCARGCGKGAPLK